MLHKITIVVGPLILIFALLSGLITYRYLDKSAKTILVLVALTLLVEQLATFFAYKFHNTNYVYGLFNPIQLYLILLYYNYSIDKFYGNNIAKIIGIICCILGLVNYFFIQSPEKMNNFFLLFESIIVIGFSLYAFYRMLLVDDNLILTHQPHFWITSIFLFFWTITFFIWGLYDYMTITLGVGVWLVHSLLIIANVINYVGFGIVFLCIKKMKNLNGR